MTTPPTASDGESSLLRVLLLQCDPARDEPILDELEEAGFVVTVVAGVPQGREKLAAVDVVVVDTAAPDAASLALLGDLARTPGAPAAVVATAPTSRTVIDGATQFGIVDYVAKVPGYARHVPTIVERAYWRRDLARRTDLLRQIVLRIQDAGAVPEAMQTVVEGARTLLGATGAVVASSTDAGGWRIAADDGDAAGLRAEVRRHSGAVTDPWPLPAHQLVAVLSAEGAHEGLLLVQRPSSRPFGADEQSLAETFAGLVGSVLRRLRRSSVEAGLIEEMQRTLRVRHDLVASVSHELRTPLTAIGGYADVLLRTDELPTDRRREFLQRIRTNTDRLERLVDELLLVADLERGRRIHPEPEPLDLVILVGDAVKVLADVTRGHEVVVETDGPVEVVADPKLVRRVLGHLVTNAVKYAPSGTSIRVSVRADDLAARVAVADEGPGVPETDAKRIFDPFWRGEVAVAQAIPGTGLGLTLVREYVGAMGGVLTLADGGPGATFEFTLPLQSQPTASR